MKEVEIYKKIRQIRKERGLTLNNLADKIGTDYQQISRIERGKSRLTIDILMKMAKALDTPIYDIVESRSEDKKYLTHHTKAHHEIALSSQDILATILEKIELFSSRLSIAFPPQVKASITSKIYGQAQEMSKAGLDQASIEGFVDFSIDLMNAMTEV
jgi:transcriptional regulator with XRE-family HTH domain